MTLTLNAGPNFLALLIGPTTRAELRAKNLADAATIHALRHALNESQMQTRMETRRADNAEHTLDAVAHAWAKTIRPSTAERRMRHWMGRGDSGAIVVARMLERASA